MSVTITKRLRASVICQTEGHLLLVRLRDPVSSVEALYPPGGGIEPGEEPIETARRETLEETGLHVRVDPDVVLVETYPFRWAGEDYEVTTHYFAASLEAKEPFDPTAALPKVIDATYNLGASWLSTRKALEALSVHPAIASAVAKVIRMTNRASWQKHPNIAGPASTLLMIHDQFRVASDRLLMLVGRESETEKGDLGWVARAFRPLAQTLHHHHHAEEAMLFPLVLKRTGVAPEKLVSDHEELTSAIEAVEQSLVTGKSMAKAKATAASFNDILIAHLDREEALVIPVLLQMTASEAWALIEGR